MNFIYNSTLFKTITTDFNYNSTCFYLSNIQKEKDKDSQAESTELNVEQSSISKTTIQNISSDLFKSSDSGLTSPTQNELGEKPKIELCEEMVTTFQKIQSLCRGYLIRRAVQSAVISDALFEQAKPFIDNPAKLKDLPKAKSGHTRVYFPGELPIVLKQSGSPKNKIRLDQMNQARHVCLENNYFHLVIPSARIHGDFIIESRLPIIKENDMKVHIGFYLEHIEELTEAVREFTSFLCQARLGDITGNGRNPYSTLSTVPIGRYDNIAMYIENGIGKLGLIDLEGFDTKSEKLQQICWPACKEAIRLFPHHFETIIQTAKKFDLNIEDHRETLENERKCVLEYFKKIYQEHLDLVKQKNISFAKPTEFIPLSPIRKEQIREVIETFIRKENVENVWFRNCLGENPDATMKDFNEIAFPEILDAVLKFVKASLKENLRYHGGITAISSYPKLLSARTLRTYAESPLYCVLKETITSKLDTLTFRCELEERRFAVEIMDTIFYELEKGKEIAYYNPRFGSGGYGFHCIFC